MMQTTLMYMSQILILLAYLLQKQNWTFSVSGKRRKGRAFAKRSLCPFPSSWFCLACPLPPQLAPSWKQFYSSHESPQFSQGVFLQLVCGLKWAGVVVVKVWKNIKVITYWNVDIDILDFNWSPKNQSTKTMFLSETIFWWVDGNYFLVIVHSPIPIHPPIWSVHIIFCFPTGCNPIHILFLPQNILILCLGYLRAIQIVIELSHHGASWMLYSQSDWIKH